MYICRETPACYFTSVTHDRLPIFRTDKLKEVLCAAYREARERHGLKIFAYVIMPDHGHVLTNRDRPMKEVLRLMNGIAARRILQHLEEGGHVESLRKLRIAVRERNHKHSVWHHHTDSLEIFAETTFLQKANYIHMNPVRAGLASDPLAYRFSSARCWAGRALEDEPLVTDEKMLWLGGGAA